MFLKAPRPLAARSLPILALLGCVGATLGALHPATAASLIARVETLVTCSTTAACVGGTNTNAGPGVAGTSKNGIGASGTSQINNGVYGLSTSSNGVAGTSTSGFGVYGYSNSFGVKGYSPNSAGVVGVSKNGTGVIAESMSGGEGLYGYALTSGDGVVGAASTGAGVLGETTNGDGLWGNSSTSGVGAGGQSYSGYGVYAESDTGIALKAYSANGIGLRSDIASGGFAVVGTSTNYQGNGADFEGGRFGIIGRAQPSGYPLVLTNSSYNNVFSVTGTGNEHVYGSSTISGDAYVYGNLHVHGDYLPLIRTANSATISAFTAKSTSPTVEDAGTAQLTAGVATVPLEPTFAAAIDKGAPYRVFLTPDGDTRGLFVALKTPRGFIVRETQAGRSTLTFDYRIVATGAGQAGRRMAFATNRDQSRDTAPATPIAAKAMQLAPRHPDLPKIAKAVIVGR